MEGFRLAQLTKEMVVTRLRTLGDPCAAGADIVKKTLEVGLKGTPALTEAAGQFVAEVCQGGLTGLILAEQSPSKGSVAILHAVAETCSTLSLDPADTMRWALRGLVQVKKILKPEDMEGVRQAINSEFDGAGEEFNRLLETPTASPGA